MKYRTLGPDDRETVTQLFSTVFTDSEGGDEGRLIGQLAGALAAAADDQEIICLGAYDKHSLLGSIFFTRLRFRSAISVYMLAPVAIATAQQGKGIGQALIRYGLEQLQRRSVMFVTTYGDPAFYQKVGFSPLAETTLPAPMPLSMPWGWQGQPLTTAPIPTLDELPSCVEAFKDPALW